MDTADTADKVVAKRGRPKKDAATPLGEYQVEEAKKARARKGKSQVVDKWYELRGVKLSLCKAVTSGTVHRTYVGSTTDPKSGSQVRDFIAKLTKEGRLRHRV